MIDNWERRTIGQCATLLSGGTPQKSRPEYWDGDIPWVSSGEMTEPRIHDTELHVSEQGAKAGSRMVPPKTVLAVVRGMSLAKEFRISLTTRQMTFNQDVKAFACASDVDSEFLFYALYARREQIRELTTEASHGTKKLETDVLTSFPILVPHPNVQRRVVDIASAYDDLIENNRRRMVLLEDAARHLYREWFVRLRFPGHEHTPIVDGVPQGWERTAFVDTCDSLEDGDWIESKDQNGEDFRLVQISNIGVNQFTETGNFRFISEETFRKLGCREVQPNQILIARMPNPIGRAWLVTEKPWRMVTAVDVAIATGRAGVADPYFLTYFLNAPATLEYCAQHAVGATRPRITRKNIGALPVLLPPNPLQKLFREVVEPINRQRTVLERQNEKLRAARDLLLPRLMSGEIPV